MIASDFFDAVESGLMMQTFFGVLEAFTQQGSEGLIEYTLWPDNHVELQNNFPLPLRNGDELKIFDENNDLLWQGAVNLIPLSYWWDNTKRNDLLHATTKQKGVSYADWLNWFCHEPPLRAELKTKN
jgi:hypothetical protein